MNKKIFKHYQKLLLVLLLCITSLVAMENDKAITQNKKPIFIPTANTPQANVDLLKAMETVFENPLQEQGWENIKKFLQNGANPNLKGSYLQPLISIVLQHGKKDLFDYVLQLGADINAQDLIEWTPLHTFIAHKPSNFCINDLLQNRANTNATTVSGQTPLFLANEKGHLDFIKPLIQYKANVNQKTDGITPLGWSIWKSNLSPAINLEAIKILCKAGASAINLDDYNHTAFHFARDEKEEFIKTLMIHIDIRFSIIENKTSTIKTVLLAFNRLGQSGLPKIPCEIQILILSKLLSPNFFHTGLYKQSKGEYYQQPPLKLINEHIQLLIQILQMKNKFQNTAIYLKSKDESFVCGYRTAEEELLEGTTLQKDLDIFNGKYPNIASIPENNLALQIFKNHYYNNS